MGTEKESFIELTERINRTTGGVSVYPFTSAVKGSPDPVAFLMVRNSDIPENAVLLRLRAALQHDNIYNVSPAACSCIA